MSTRAPAASISAQDAPHRFLPLLILFFIGSGCAALIYEIVWFQMLSLIVGSSALSLGVILGTFMGGMCIGSLWLSKVISRQKHPLLVYAGLEVGIAVLGVLELLLLPHVSGFYSTISLEGMPGLFMRAIFCVIALLPPTLLMGATLPAIARWVEATPRGMSWLGFFYGGNIAGAVLGCLLAGFYLLRVHGVAYATGVAVAINLAVAAAAFALSRFAAYEPGPDAGNLTVDADDVASDRENAPIYVAAALSGMSALAAEVVWTRILSLILGGTVYTFSLILSGFLFGLGVGSSLGSLIGRDRQSARRALIWCQFLLMAGVAWAGHALTQQLPYWPINPGLSTDPKFTFQIDMIRAMWVTLPSAILWGASFPLALAAAGAQKDSGRLVGRMYAANTVGAIIGSAITALFFIQWFGTVATQRMVIVLAAISTLVLLAPMRRNEAGKYEMETSRILAGMGTVVFAAVMYLSIAPIPPLLAAYGRWMPLRMENINDVVAMEEGQQATIAITRLSNGVLNYHNAGKVQASSEPQDMRLQRMLGHLTTLLPPKADNVLVIGFGAGVTAGAVSIDPAVKTQTIAEIEPLVPITASKWFGEHNFNVRNNPKVTVKIDDGRHFLLTTDRKFDAITSDPLDPWVKGAAALYSEEFWTLTKNRLNPGGVVTVFVQLYESSPEAVKSEVATFFEVFPDGMVFGNTYNGAGYDIVMVGSNGPLRIDVDAIQAKLDRPEYAPMRQSLMEVGFPDAASLFGTFAGQKQHLAPWMADAQINHDNDMRLQYLAGLGLNRYDQASIYSGMIANRRYPEGLFVGSPGRLNQIRSMIGGY
ncbi:MAG: fused MFS/spermidine synthase [Gemmatimonadaceae bacterium]